MNRKTFIKGSMLVAAGAIGLDKLPLGEVTPASAAVQPVMPAPPTVVTHWRTYDQVLTEYYLPIIKERLQHYKHPCGSDYKIAFLNRDGEILRVTQWLDDHPTMLTAVLTMYCPDRGYPHRSCHVDPSYFYYRIEVPMPQPHEPGRRNFMLALKNQLWVAQQVLAFEAQKLSLTHHMSLHQQYLKEHAQIFAV